MLITAFSVDQKEETLKISGRVFMIKVFKVGCSENLTFFFFFTYKCTNDQGLLSETAHFAEFLDLFVLLFFCFILFHFVGVGGKFCTIVWNITIQFFTLRFMILEHILNITAHL